MKPNIELSSCKNCGTSLSGDYCNGCGQRTSVNKVTFKETFDDLVDSIFSVNAPFWRTLKLLFINPGKCFREYLGGMRKSYYKPVAFFLLLTIVYLATRSLINFDPFSHTTLTVSDDTPGQLLEEARKFMFLNIDKLLFIYVFSLGLLLKLFFFKRHSLAEFLAISFYIAGMYSLFTILNLFYIQYINSNFQLLAILIMFVYLNYALISFFRKKKLLIFFKGLIIYFLAFLIYGSAAYGVSFVIVWLKQI